MISSEFADIFKNNALNNGVLVVTVSPDFLSSIFNAIDTDPTTGLKVDLVNQFVEIIATNEKESFEINSYRRECLINGYDNIDYLLSQKEQIEAYELNR